MNQPYPSDFEAYTYDANENITVMKSYRQNGRYDISGVVNNTGTITITTSKAHNIICAWNSGHTYGVGVMVNSHGSVYISLQAANLNKNPKTQSVWWNELSWDQEKGSDVVSIDGVVGMTSLNTVFTVVNCLTTTTFIVTLSTVQTYTSGGTVRRGVFQYKWKNVYDSNDNLIDRKIFYEDI